MAVDYETVGAFHSGLAADLRAFVDAHGEAAAFCGDPSLQIDARVIDMPGAAAVRCRRTALAAIDAIVRQGEGASANTAGSHFQRFAAIRSELQDLQRSVPSFQPAHPRPPTPRCAARLARRAASGSRTPQRSRWSISPTPAIS